MRSSIDIDEISHKMYLNTMTNENDYTKTDYDGNIIFFENKFDNIVAFNT